MHGVGQPRARSLLRTFLAMKYQMHAKDLSAFVDVDIEICMRRSEILKLELFQKHRNLPDFGTKKVIVCVCGERRRSRPGGHGRRLCQVDKRWPIRHERQEPNQELDSHTTVERTVEPENVERGTR